MDELLKTIITDLYSMEEDNSIPKNIRIKIKKVIDTLSVNNKSLNLVISRSLEELNEIVDDANVPQYTKMQIWSIVSQLESKD
ncbi:MAG TPA: UPF0147 family protein [Candidatus Nanoarchaeia archaeon]|nr:UPF0147 family protein [Candidatus Nanoarchaeia archaeon]